MEKNKQFGKNLIWNTIGTTLNAFNSLLFAIIVTRINGINDAGIFTYSFATACILFVIGIYFGRTFQVTDITNKYSDTDYIFNRIITCILMIVAAVSFCLIKKYDLYKSSILVLLSTFKSIEAFSEALYGIMQRKDRLDKVGKSFTIKSIVSLLSFLSVDLITHNLVVSCITLCIVNIIVVLIYDFTNIKKLEIVKSKFTIKNNNILLKIGFFTFILTFLSQYIINSSRYAIDDILPNDLQTVYGIIIMPATFMGLLGQFIIQPILIKLSNCIKEGNKKELIKLILQVISIICALGIIALIFAYALGIQMLEIVYGIELSDYLLPLIIIMVGATMYSIELFASTVLIALRKTFGQALLYFIISIASTVIAYILVNKYSILGASISYLITMLLIAVVLVLYMSIAIYHNFKENKKVNN
ncbi:MAG: hypothetical protein IKF17_04800 [Clostridia bacterium]|nr:hypothetical protein [Clostridia bacterium]